MAKDLHVVLLTNYNRRRWPSIPRGLAQEVPAGPALSQESGSSASHPYPGVTQESSLNEKQFRSDYKAP